MEQLSELISAIHRAILSETARDFAFSLASLSTWVWRYNSEKKKHETDRWFVLTATFISFVFHYFKAMDGLIR